MKERHYIKDPVKPPFHSYQPPCSIPRLSKISKDQAMRIFHSNKWSERNVRNCHITDLREIFVDLLESSSLPKDFNQILFTNVVIDHADLTELAIKYKLHFQNCFFLQGLHFNHSSFPLVTISGYICGNLSLNKLNGNPIIVLQNLQVDQVYLEGGECIENFGISTTTIGRLTIANTKISGQVNLHDNVNILDGIWFDNLIVKRGILLWRCKVESYFRIYNVKCQGNIELLVCDLVSPLNTKSSSCIILSLNESKCYSRLNFKGLQFDKLDVGNTTVIGQLLFRLRQLKEKPDNKFDISPCLTITKSNTLGDDISIEEQLIVLHENFKKIPTATRQEEYCAYQLRETIERQNRKGISNKINHFVFKWCFGYLLIPKRIVLTMIGIILVFAFSYYLLSWLNLGCLNFSTGGSIFKDGKLIGLGRSLYFSVVTFSTLGYGDIYPIGTLKLLATLESFSGLVIVSIFAVSVARKLFRW